MLVNAAFKPEAIKGNKQKEILPILLFVFTITIVLLDRAFMWNSFT